MSLSLGSALTVVRVTGVRNIRDGREVNALPRRVLQFRMCFRLHLDDSDDPLFVARVVEEAALAFLHLAHVGARLEIPHAVPFLAGGAFRLLLLP